MKISLDNKQEIFEIVKNCKDINQAVDELKQSGMKVEKEDIEELLKGKSFKLVDEQLENVVGGGNFNDIHYWGNRSSVKYIYNVNDTVEVASGFGFGTTVKCKIKELGIGYFDLANGGCAYFDTYYCENVDYTWYFYDGWKTRDMIEKR